MAGTHMEAERSEEQQTWAATVLAQHAAVERLHSPEPRWQVAGAEEGGSWRDKDDALEALREGTYDSDGQPEGTEADLSFFLVCHECSRIEEDFARQQAPDAEWGYLESLWPCPTAKAMGHTEDTA